MGEIQRCEAMERQLSKLLTFLILAMHWPRLSETEPKWFVFKFSWYVFGGRILCFRKVNVNKVNVITVSY